MTTRSRYWTRAACGMAVLLWVAGCREDEKPGTGTGDPDLVARAACPDDPNSNDTRIAAMLSVHAHALWPDRRFPEEVQVMSLPSAIECLKADPELFASSRRRRAIAKLGAAGLENEGFEAAVVGLGGDPVEIERIAKKPRAKETSSFSFPRSAHAQTGGTVTKAQVESEVADLYEVYSPTNCMWKKHLAVVDSNGPEVSMTVSIEVKRDVREVTRAIDPQSWDQCSKFFMPPERTYLLKDTNATDLSQVDSAVPAGAVYPWRPLLEHFVCKACPSEFRNVLSVKSEKQSANDEHRFSYKLQKTVSSAVGKSKAPADLVTDGGKLWVKRDATGKTIAGAKKTVRFRQLYGTVGAAIGLQQTEQAGEFAEMVCCLVGSSGS